MRRLSGLSLDSASSPSSAPLSQLPFRPAVDVRTVRAQSFAACVVTLAVDPASQEKIEAWRTRFFPAERNFIPAHLSLFHALPGAGASRWLPQLEETARRTRGFDLRFSRAVASGTWGGVTVDSDALRAVHQGLVGSFQDMLTTQDAQVFRPHVTVLNKWALEEARERQVQFASLFSPWTGQATGFDAWGYAGGPWEHLHFFPFAL